ncbi:MAG: alkaline phosphatase family protein [Actinomycetes bacterium]
MTLLTAAVVSGCSGSDAPTVVPGSTSSATSTPTLGPSAQPSPSPSPTASSPATRPAGALCGWLRTPPKRYQHVIWIWFENKSAGTVIGSSHAPYFNQVAAKCALATNFHNVSHPSLPNYLAATSGRTGGVASDCSPAACSSSSRSIFRQLEIAGLTWKAYAESMPSGCAHYDADPYAVKHNPPPYYRDIAPTCRRNNLPLDDATTGLGHDLAHDSLPNFAFVTPNLCNDMHDCSVSTGDSWMKKWLTRIADSRAYDSGRTAIFLTFDEGTGGGHGEDCATPANNDSSCLIATYALGPAVRPGARIATRLTHYSMLRSTESMLGLTSYLGNAATAPDLRAPFHL